MKIILLIAILFAPSDHEEIQGIQLAMPHTHQSSVIQKIGQLSKKCLQL